MKVALHEISKEHPLKYVVIATRYQSNWYMVKHKDRITWEMPGGHIEPGESPDEAARRELYEETGGVIHTLTPIYDYSVTKEESSYGRLYFAELLKLDTLPESEIEVISILKDEMKWTYDQIQPILLNGVLDYLETE